MHGDENYVQNCGWEVCRKEIIREM
jgi:hypothetical protein